MRGSEQERQQLIDRLKTTKNPTEREKILWALEGMRKEAYKTASPPVEQARGPSVPPEEKMKLPLQMPKGLGQLMRYGVPFFFIIFGFSFILQGVVRGIERNDLASEAGQFITGILFIAFGASAFLRAKKMAKGTPENG